MNIYHSSPETIKKIDKYGAFDDCLFFSSSVYSMSVGEVVVYSLEIDEEKIIHVSDLHNDDVIENISSVLDVSDEEAERILDSRDSVFNHGGSAEDDWWIQAKQGECAKLMGYEACESRDEQGVVYIVPMFDRESDLILVSGEDAQ